MRSDPMRMTRPRLALASIAVFVVVAVGFVLAMRSCEKAAVAQTAFDSMRARLAEIRR